MTVTSYDIAQKHGMLSADEVQAIKRCAMMVAKNPIAVNIGAGFGTSTIAILESRPDARVYELDKRIRTEAIQYAQLAGFEQQHRISRVIGRSQDIGKNWVWPIDLLFVDGDHTDEGVLGDIEVWVPFVKHMGVIIFHDYKHPNLPRLTEIVDREMAEYQVVDTARYLIAYQVGGKKQGR